jgi:hypothetical protein
METKTFKTVAANGAVSTVKFIVAPVHLTLQVATNIVAALGEYTCNSIAKGEGFIVEHLNGTPREETAALRTEYTQMKMFEAAMKADAIRQKIQGSINTANNKVSEIGHKIKTELTQPRENKDSDSIAFALATLKANRQEVIDDLTLVDKDRNILLNAINKEIAVLNKMKKVPTIQPAVAFS